MDHESEIFSDEYASQLFTKLNRFDSFRNKSSVDRVHRRQSITKNLYSDDRTPRTSLESEVDDSILFDSLADDLETCNTSQPEASTTSISLSHKSYIEIPLGFSPVPDKRKPLTMQNTTSTVDLSEEDDDEGSIGINFGEDKRDDDDCSICWDVLLLDSDSESTSTSSSPYSSSCTSLRSSSYSLLSASTESFTSEGTVTSRIDCDEVLDDEIFGEFFKNGDYREAMIRQNKSFRSRPKNKKPSTGWKQSRDNSHKSVSFSRREPAIIDDALALKKSRMILRDYHYKIDYEPDCEQPDKTRRRGSLTHDNKQLVRATEAFSDYTVSLDASKDTSGKALRRFSRTSYQANNNSDDEDSISIDATEPSLDLHDLKHDEEEEDESIDIGDFEDEETDDERPKDIFRSFLYSIGGMALVGAVGAIWKFVSKLINEPSGEEANLVHQISEVTEWSVELLDVSMTSLGGSGMMSNAATATATASAHGSGVCATASAAGSVGLNTSASAIGTTAAATAAAEATALAVTQAAVVEGMAISAASTASGAVAGGATAAGMAAAGTASVSTTTAIVATTATAGVLACASGATTCHLPEMASFINGPSGPIPCPEIPVSAPARVIISFSRYSDSIAADLVEGNGDWGLLASEILETYNEISNQCYELYQRSMINVTYEFTEFNDDTDMIETYWTSYVSCNSSCPVEDPLFGIKDSDIVDPDSASQDIVATRMLRPNIPSPSAAPSRTPSSAPSIVPSAAPSTAPSDVLSGAPSSAPTVRPKIAISRQEFLDNIRADNVEPLPLPTIFPSNSPSTVPSAEPMSSLPDSPSESPSMHPHGAHNIFSKNHPSVAPIAVPSAIPSGMPSYRPSESLSKQPSGSPSSFQASGASDMPSSLVSFVPSSISTGLPTVPTGQPTIVREIIGGLSHGKPIRARTHHNIFAK